MEHLSEVCVRLRVMKKPELIGLAEVASSRAFPFFFTLWIPQDVPVEV